MFTIVDINQIHTKQSTQTKHMDKAKQTKHLSMRHKKKMCWNNMDAPAGNKVRIQDFRSMLQFY